MLLKFRRQCGEETKQESELQTKSIIQAHAVGVSPSSLGADPAGKANELIRLRLPGGQLIQVEEAVALLIKALVSVAELYLKQPVKRAVLGVPARWTKAQRYALEYSAKLAGLTSVRLIPEPELAVRAYGVRASPNAHIITGGGNLGAKPMGLAGNAELDDLQQRIEEDPYSASQEDWRQHMEVEMKQQDPTLKHILVADLGGGTFDVCIVRKWVEWDEIHMLCTSGDERLGGDDFDQALADWVLKELKSELTQRRRWPLPAIERQKLLVQARKAKERLSSSDTADILLDDLQVTVSKDNFRVVCLAVLERMLQPIREAAYGAHLRLPFESLAIETMDAAGRARKRKLSQKDLQRKTRSLRAKHKSSDVEDREEIMVDEILLIGAATWTPAVREMLTLCTGVQPTSAVIDPETAVALGAAILASIMDNQMVDMQVHSNWRAAWTKYLLERPELVEKMEAERRQKAATVPSTEPPA
ncbi:dnaK [Symbiodinium natans]|uniref:DnaK protein n=1 Tax=Symbiodinium natans TaxID=878477 RepID=A0A812JPQ5_9DINO|nr:dnaK [Symbiodinium natans]